MKPKVDLYIYGASEVITCVPGASDRLGRIPDGEIAIADGRIVALGQRSFVEEGVDLSPAKKMDVSGKIVAPGFVDCHTHLVFGGSRVLEYALKMTKSVAEIEAMGLKTGIPASIQMTREESEDALFE